MPGKPQAYITKWLNKSGCSVVRRIESFILTDYLNTKCLISSHLIVVYKNSVSKNKKPNIEMTDVQYGRFGPLIGSLDEGTSSVRFIIFSARTADVIAQHQCPLKQFYPAAGYVELDPKEVINLVNLCIEKAMQKLVDLEVAESDVVALGIANQRETAVAWNRVTGEPLYNAIVWSDIRTQSLAMKLIEDLPDKNSDHFKQISGLPITSTFSALKYRWLLEEVPAVRAAADEDCLCFGTIDSWLIYNLTGGKNNGIFITDCTNASRTLLMNLKSLSWDSNLCKFFNINPRWLPEIRSSSEIYGYVESGILKGVPISGCIGDQQGALLGHQCWKAGQAKNTYGTGCFVLCNTGSRIINSQHGLIGTVAFKMGKNIPAQYAIEGSVAVAGSAFNWLSQNLEILDSTESAEAIAEIVPESDNVYFVPAFSGLYAPYWRPDARGIIVGITEKTKVSHLVKAALDAVCFQTRDILEAMENDCGLSLKYLLVDGGMTKNNLLMQLQANLVGIPVVKSNNSEITALGAAMAAGSAEGIQVWNFDRSSASAKKVFRPSISSKERDLRYFKWKDAVENSFGWISE